MITESEARQLDQTPAEQQSYLAGSVVSFIGLFLLGQVDKVGTLLKAKARLDELIACAVQEKVHGMRGDR